ncbi:hypothetical protein SDJN03_19540, partial [Cucurbita argyrosperma subsp. sororia]
MLDRDLEKVCAVLEHDLPQKLRAQAPAVGILQALQTYLIVVSLLLLFPVGLDFYVIQKHSVDHLFSQFFLELRKP